MGKHLVFFYAEFCSNTRYGIVAFRQYFQYPRPLKDSVEEWVENKRKLSSRKPLLINVSRSLQGFFLPQKPLKPCRAIRIEGFNKI